MDDLSTFVNSFTPYQFEKYGWIRLPAVDLTKEEKDFVGAPENCSNYDLVRHLVWRGLNELISKENQKP